MDAAERELLASTVSEVLTDTTDADAALAGLGWLDMLGAEPDDAIAIVFEALGLANASSSALDDVVAFGLGVTARPDLAVMLPPFGSWEPPELTGLATRRVESATALLVSTERTSATLGLGGAASGASSIGVTAISGIDPEFGLHTITLAADAVRGATALADGAWDRAVALAQRAIAYETVGACRAMLDLARTHALERVQFDRPIARFQAVRHRLAETLVAIEGLDAALIAAADEPGPMTAALAKAVAGRTARTVHKHTQQVLAGIGFTTDHALHRYVKRTMLLDGLFGSADELVLDLGHQLLERRDVPTLVEL
jgi:hypothetical protein